MKVDEGQRWENRTQVLRRRGDGVADTANYTVTPIAAGTAKAFVSEHHYSATFPAAVSSFGLFYQGSLAGVAVYSVPVNNKTISNVFGAGAEGYELGRFVLHPVLPFNSETWFLARTNRLLRAERPKCAGVVAFSDPVPRMGPNGVFSPGHRGQIYQASTAHFLGRSAARRLRVTRDGAVLHERTLSKIRTATTGWRGAVQHLVELGAAAPRCVDSEPDPDELKHWLKTQLPLVSYDLFHPGNLRYAIGFQERKWPLLTDSLPYLKRLPDQETIWPGHRRQPVPA